MYLPIIAALLVASSKAATILYVASYGGAVSTLSLSQQLLGPYSLRKVASTTACASNPSWLTLDQQRRVLYCIGEGLDSKTGGLTAFITHCNGSLSRVSATDTVLGGVNAITYGVGASSAAIAIAH